MKSNQVGSADLGPEQLPHRPNDDANQFAEFPEPPVKALTFTIDEKGRPMNAKSTGGGAKFAALDKKLSDKGAKDPKALAAAIGIQKFGKATFEAMAAKGRKRADEQSDKQGD